MDGCSGHFELLRQEYLGGINRFLRNHQIFFGKIGMLGKQAYFISKKAYLMYRPKKYAESEQDI